MKLLTVFTCVFGVVAALKPATRGGQAPRPKAVAVEMRAPSGLVAGYTTSTSTPTQLRSKAALTKVPSSQRRRQLEPQPADFFECTNPNPSPSSADCKVIINQVLSTDDLFIIAPNSCLVFSYGTCQGFFCSLCEELETTTQFIGSQLDTVDALCVEGGQGGTIVGEDAPQWDAGFTYAGQGLPTFDVC